MSSLLYLEDIAPRAAMMPWKHDREWGAAILPMDALSAINRLVATLVVSKPDDLARAVVTAAAERLPVNAIHLALREGGEMRSWSSTPGASLTGDWRQIQDVIDSGEPSLALPADGRAATGVRVIVPVASGEGPYGALIADTAPAAAAEVGSALEALRWPLGLRLAELVRARLKTHEGARNLCAEMYRCETLTALWALLLGALPELLGADWATVATYDPQERLLHETTLDGPAPLDLNGWAQACAAAGDGQGRATPFCPLGEESGDERALAREPVPALDRKGFASQAFGLAILLRADKSPLRYVLAIGGKKTIAEASIPLLEEVAAHAEVSLARIVAAGELRLVLETHGRVLRVTQLLTSLNQGESPDRALGAVMAVLLQDVPGLTAGALHLWMGSEPVHEQSVGAVPPELCRGAGLRWWQERLTQSALARWAGYWPLPEPHDGSAVLITMPILARDTGGDDGRVLGVVSLFATSPEITDLVLRTMLSPFSHVITQLVQNLQQYRALERANHELEQRKAQIIENKSALEAILDGFPGGLYIVDRDLRVTLSNDVQMLRVQGSGPSTGQHCWELYGSGSGVCPGCRVMDTVRKGISTRRRMRVRRPGQPEREWEVATHPITRRSARGTQKALVIVRDVTEQEQIVKSLAQVEKLAAVGRLAAGIAHEINNPLAAIQANVQLLLGNTSPDDGQYESLAIMGRSAERARRVVRNLLSFSEPSLDHPVPADVNATIRAALELVSHRSQQSGVVLDCHLAEGLPRARASQEQLESVWLNLALNALDAVLERGRRGRIEVTSEPAPHGQIRVTFRDNGPGIPPHRLPYVFEPFGSSASPVAGTGLGLFSCHNVVKRHGGCIRARAGEGGGALFEVLLPALSEGDEEPDAARDASAMPAAGGV